MILIRWQFLRWLLTRVWWAAVVVQAALASKRGLAYVGDNHASDIRLLASNSSEIDWYYTWSLYNGSQIPDTLQFVPMIHGLDDANNAATISTLNTLPRTSTHLLTFNEPDGTTGSGGSSVDPADAARAYLSRIAPLRAPSAPRTRTWNISHPSVTGSGRGLDWLRRFNASCFAQNPSGGCPADFVAVHWYGDFAGLAAWLGTLHQFYFNASAASGLVAGAGMWVTEMALPQQSGKTTLAMMNQSLPFLDGLEYVDNYAWFGAFRAGDANEWTGDGVALFDNGGGLTELGALYLGGRQRGFKVGMTGAAANLALSPLIIVSAMMMIGLSVW